MSYTVKKLPNSEVEIKITVEEEDMKKYMEKAAEEISHHVDIKGFRKGHVPLHVLEDHIGKKHILAQAKEIAIQKSYADAVIKENLPVVSRPKIVFNSEEPFSFTATVAVLPDTEIKDYKSIKIPKKEIKVSEKDVEAVLDDMKKHGTVYKEVERKSKKGDRAEVDFEGFDGDKSVEGTKSANHPVILGENTMIPGFEDELIGLKKGEKKEFNITFPKDYHKKDFQNKKLKFKVEMKKVEEPETPEITEELIEKMTGQKRKVAEFKKDIEKNILARKEEEAKRKRENDYVEELLKKTKVDIPPQLVDEETEFILQDMKEEIGRKGLEFDKFLEQARTTEEDLRKKYRPEAEKRIKIRLALQHVIKEEKVLATDEEVKKEFEKVQSFYPEDQKAKIQEDFDKGELKTQITNRLTLRKLFKKVLE